MSVIFVILDDGDRLRLAILFGRLFPVRKVV
jgi:hypothetical protein